MTLDRQTFDQLVGSKWAGSNELWLDPAGNEALVSVGTIEVEKDAVHYTWVYEGQKKEGRIEIGADFVSWTDTWHQPTGMKCHDLPIPGAILSVMGRYPAPPGPDWGWRLLLARRPSGELVLQMTNITPWGEEGRAVRLVGTRP